MWVAVTRRPYFSLMEPARACNRSSMHWFVMRKMGYIIFSTQLTQFVSVWLLLWIEITYTRMGWDGDWCLLLVVVDPGSHSTVPPVFCNNSTPRRGSSAVLFDRGIQLGIGCQWAAEVSHYCTQKWDNCKSVSAQSPNVNVTDWLESFNGVHCRFKL